MKKALVLLLALCAVSAFAQDAAYTLEAEASVTWGYDLNTDANGFVNDASFDLVFPIAAGDTAANEATDGVYGQISITGLNLAIASNMDGAGIIDNLDEDGYYDTFEAKIIAGPMYATIFKAPSFKLNNAQTMGPVSIDEWEDESLTANTAMAFVLPDPTRTIGGITFGYKNELFDAALLLGSTGSYEAEDPDEDLTDESNVDSEYTVGFALTLTPVEMLEFKVKAFADLYDGANKGLTLKATVTPIEGLELIAAMDSFIAGSADMVWDSSFGATYTLANASSVALSTYFAPKETYASTDAYLELGLTLTEDGEEGFVPALGAEAYFKAYDLLADSAGTVGIPAYVGLSVDYTVTLEEGKTVMPYAAFDYGLLRLDLPGTEFPLTFKVGVDVNLIANTTITVEYAAGEVIDDATPVGFGQIAPFGSDLGEDKGLFTVACTIEL